MLIPQNFIVDNENRLKSPIGICGRRLKLTFILLLVRLQQPRNIEKCVRRANLSVKDLILEPLASSDAVLTDDKKKLEWYSSISVEGPTDLAVYYDNIIRHTAVIPLGGNVVTKDI